LDERQYRYDRLTDWADTTASAFLGLTMGCARCHDHKFDPISQKDYFRLQAVFGSSAETQIPFTDTLNIKNWEKGGVQRFAAEDILAAIKRLEKQVRARVDKKASKEQVLASYSIEERREHERLSRKFVEVSLSLPASVPAATVLGRLDRAPPVRLAIRGDSRNPGEEVRPGTPSALPGPGEFDESLPRKSFALWLTNPEHPLTARVVVNRVWQAHFGRGLVATPNDFGRQGDAPSHPELLDYLAAEFVANGWKLKALHRTILLSNAYQASNRPDRLAARVDPDNKLLWRMNRRRLDAESIRDAMLAVSGQLNTKMYGPPVIAPLTTEELSALEDSAQWPSTLDESEARRRSIYLYNKRTFRMPMLEIFDSPDNSLSCARREATTVAPQALALLNNDFVWRQAQAFAARLWKEKGTADIDSLIERAWRDAVGREPSAADLEDSRRLLNRLEADSVQAPRELSRLCMTLFNLNEFLYVD
jgi:hypothetical protein